MESSLLTPRGTCIGATHQIEANFVIHAVPIIYTAEIIARRAMRLCAYIVFELPSFGSVCWLK